MEVFQTVCVPSNAKIKLKIKCLLSACTKIKSFLRDSLLNLNTQLLFQIVKLARK